MTRLEPHKASLFHGYLRLEAVVAGEGVLGIAAHLARLAPGEQTQRLPHQETAVLAEGEGVRIVLQALVAPEDVPDGLLFLWEVGGETHRLPIQDFMRACYLRQRAGCLEPARLAPLVADFAKAHGRRARLLDLGGRPRSGNSYADQLGPCDITVFDIVADPGVDVVGDAHALSRHFAPGSFDFVFSASVFEHLLMPWKVALEINRVLRPGGYALIKTHQALGLHELPWDFWRYSDFTWDGLFNARTGFRVLEARMGQPLHLVTMGWAPQYRGGEAAAGFENAGVLVQKTGETRLRWDVSLAEVVTAPYPALNDEKTPAVVPPWPPARRGLVPWARAVGRRLRRG